MLCHQYNVRRIFLYCGTEWGKVEIFGFIWKNIGINAKNPLREHRVVGTNEDGSSPYLLIFY
jgi:hypothetical protein